MPDAPAYVKYSATGITALLCRKCVTEREMKTIAATPDGLEPIPLAHAIVCSRCGETP